MTHVVRRLGQAPRDRGCHSNSTCPDVFELDDGGFAVIGALTDPVTLRLPEDAVAAPREAVAVIPRDVFMHAMDDLPDA